MSRPYRRWFLWLITARSNATAQTNKRLNLESSKTEFQHKIRFTAFQRNVCIVASLLCVWSESRLFLPEVRSTGWMSRGFHESPAERRGAEFGPVKQQNHLQLSERWELQKINMKLRWLTVLMWNLSIFFWCFCFSSSSTLHQNILGHC